MKDPPTPSAQPLTYGHFTIANDDITVVVLGFDYFPV